MPFNKAQEAAVNHGEGPMMVLAGPGSGKTTVVTHRVQSLIERHGVNPSSILVITFTRAAAREMKERFERLMEGRCLRGQVSFGTFHAVFFRILKLAYGYEAADIIREDQRLRFMRELVAKEQLEPEDENELIASLLSEISSVKGELIDLDHYYAKSCSEEAFKRIYAGYEERLRRNRKIDFDDMLVMCYELFRQRPDILGAWQKKYAYILVDEFQDINRLQYEIVRMLAAPRNNLFIVGDDDQSIYRFRGARPEIMLGFERDYPDAGRVLLNVNYRSTKEIVDASLRLIGNNEKRFKKSLRTAGSRGRKVITRVWKDEEEENSRIAEEIRMYSEAGCAYRDIAVLYRTNSGPRRLIEKLMEYNLPFKARDVVPNLYEHWISKNILAYIRVALGSRERGEVLQMINRPARYISRDALQAPQISFDEVKGYYRDKDWMVERIESLEFDLTAISRMSPLAAVNYIRKSVGYDAWLYEYAAAHRMKADEFLETADQLKESAARYKTFDAWFSHISEYGEELKRQAREREQTADAVTLSTMHSSKGLEYRVVYILDANEGVTPHSKAVLDADIEEERRLFYVAMTRAKQRLHVYSVKERYHKPAEVSRFVEEYLDGEEEQTVL
ncbi:UNVERIFIED_ORG: ATP-dependent DNA helicase [Lacrimispora saccharolytica]